MKVLVTGATGFLGTRVVRHLQDEGYTVLTTDMSGVCDFVGDLACNDFVCKLPNVDIVVHCAAVQYVTNNKPFLFWKNYFYRNNVVATENIVNRYKNSAKYFVHVGTSMQYHQNRSTIYDETSPMKSQGVYSWSKLLAQDVIDKLTIPCATVIPCIIGGPGREGLFRGFVRSIEKYSLAIIPGKGNHKISIVHVDDVASLIVRLVVTRAEGKFNAAASDSMTINEWAELIARTLGKRDVKIYNLPLLPVTCISKLTKYRLLANEQLVMLSMSHVLDTKRASSIGALSKKTCINIIEDITRHLVGL